MTILSGGNVAKKRTVEISGVFPLLGTIHLVYESKNVSVEPKCFG